MAPKQRRNLYVDATGGDGTGFGVGLTILFEECKRLEKNHGWLICPQKTNFTSGHIEKVVGQSAAKLLGTGKAVTVNGIVIVPQTVTKLPSIGDGSPCLAAYLSVKDLAKVDDLYEIPSLIVVPWAVDMTSDTDTETWRSKWSPEIFRPA